MSVHIFNQTGYEASAVAVVADSELEARGKLQKTWHRWSGVQYCGTVEEITEREGDDVLELTHKSIRPDEDDDE